MFSYQSFTQTTLQNFNELLSRKIIKKPIKMKFAEITGWGKCLPPATLTNDDLATFLPTSDEWIVSRTGIRERRILHCKFSDMAIVASQRAIAAAGLIPSEIDLILLGCLTPDSSCPNTASLIADGIGATNAAAIDVNTACTGFLHGMHIGTSLIQTGAHKKILVIGGEYITHYVNWARRDIAVLFGDACGAVILESSREPIGLLSSKIGCESNAKHAIQITNFGSGYDRFDKNFGYFGWNFKGQEVFKRAVKSMANACDQVLADQQLTIADIDLVVPHQANIRIIEALGKRLGIPEEKVFVNVHKYGNTSAGTIPVALAEASEEGRIKPGSLILMASFGAGLTWAAGVVRWGERTTPLRPCDAELPPNEKTALEILAPTIQAYKIHSEKIESEAAD